MQELGLTGHVWEGGGLPWSLVRSPHFGTVTLQPCTIQYCINQATVILWPHDITSGIHNIRPQFFVQADFVGGLIVTEMIHLTAGTLFVTIWPAW
jgi:hypothetical protein